MAVEETGSGTGLTGAALMDSLATSWADIPIEESAKYDQDTFDRLPATESKADDALAGDPVVDGKPVDAAESTEGEPAAETDPAAPVVDVPAVDARDAALVAAAKALGLTEMDPAKIPAALAAHNEKVAAQQDTDRVEQERVENETAEKTILQQASDYVSKIVDPIASQQALDAMRNAGFSEVNTPAWWMPETWEDPNVASQLMTEYQSRFAAAKAAAATEPQYEQIFQDQYGRLKAGHEAEKAKISGLATIYPHYSPELVADLRKAGMSPQGIERIAQATHAHGQRLLATTNSALAAKDAELTALRAQISDQSAAIAQARAEGLAEGQGAAMTELKKSADLKVSVGTGVPAGGPAKGYTFSTSDGSIDYSSIPFS